MTKPFLVFGVFVLIAAFFLARRFLFGLSDVTHLSGGYPWGIWAVIDVVIGTAIGCGGYSHGPAGVHLQPQQYHPLMRPALLGGMFGYTLGGMAVMFDLGRYWNVYNLFLPWQMQLNSVMFEIALCVMAYITVAWIEFWPAFLERLPLAFKQRFGLDQLHRFLKRYMFVFIAIGVLLPTMHQSSLGSALLVMGIKLSPLWYTPWLPLLFLLSALHHGLRDRGVRVDPGRPGLQPADRDAPAGEAVARRRRGLLAGYLVVRFGDLLWRGALGWPSPAISMRDVLAGNLLFIVPVFICSRGPPCALVRGFIFLSAISLLLAGSLYRLNVYLIGYHLPGRDWHYFPSVGEVMVTWACSRWKSCCTCCSSNIARVAPRRRRRIPQPEGGSES